VRADPGFEFRHRDRGLRVLDFDCECRPIAWYGDWVTKQVTAIAWKYCNEPEKANPRVAYIGKSDRSSKVLNEECEMLEEFLEEYKKADVVTGHFIRGFDLPLINGSLIRLGMDQLPDKLAQDTKGDLAKAQGISKSQENLGSMFEMNHPKVGMDTGKWGRANMLLPEGISECIERVVGDVNQHIELRQRMLDLGVLGAPSPWSPRAGHGSTKYQA
jgi:DNA polymerase elongation subunit (family B)